MYGLTLLLTIGLVGMAFLLVYFSKKFLNKLNIVINFTKRVRHIYYLSFGTIFLLIELVKHIMLAYVFIEAGIAYYLPLSVSALPMIFFFLLPLMDEKSKVYQAANNFLLLSLLMTTIGFLVGQASPQLSNGTITDQDEYYYVHSYL
jgi:hypothetical protein